LAGTEAALTVEAPAEYAIGLDELASHKIAENEMLGDSPLAHSLRRRQQEIAQGNDAIAGHDSIM
jgi:predicted transcriptional regulator